MTNSKLDESIFDALFGQAVIDNFNEQLDLLADNTDIVPQLTFSHEHEKRMMLLFAKENRKERLRKTVKWSKRVAAILILTISLLFGSLMFVPEVRAVVIGTVVEWFDQFTRFTSTAPEAEKTNLEPTYIPNGFWEDYRDGNDFTTIILFINNEDISIFFELSKAIAQLSVSNEGYDYEIIKLDSIEYHIFTSLIEKNESFIVWESDGQRYQVASLISVDELLKMALSVG